MKLADFGLSLPLSQDNIKTYGGHARWMAPELWLSQTSLHQQSKELCLMSDVFSYGLILLFLITGKTPWHSITDLDYPTASSSSNSGSFSRGISSSEPPDKGRFEIPGNFAPELLAIIQHCYQEKPTDRANCSQVNYPYYKG